MLLKVKYLREGPRVYKRAGLTNVFHLEMTFTSIQGAKRFCANQPPDSAVRYAWAAHKLGVDVILKE